MPSSSVYKPLVEYSFPKVILVLRKRVSQDWEYTFYQFYFERSVQLYSRVTFGEACLDMKTTMHVVGPNEVIDLATLNLTVMQYCIT